MTDFFKILEINIIPTMSEILCATMPALPGNYVEYPEAHWMEPGPCRLLDMHFRLLREGQLIFKVQYF